MNYTNEQIRTAILSAADVFERSPELFDFWVTRVPECDTPGCALGYVAKFLGFENEVGAFEKTANVLGCRTAFGFYDELNGCGNKFWEESAPGAVTALRWFADEKFPVQP